MMFSVCVFGFVKLEFEIFYVVVDVFGVWLVELLYVGDDFYFDIVGVLNVGFQVVWVVCEFWVGGELVLLQVVILYFMLCDLVMLCCVFGGFDMVL